MRFIGISLFIFFGLSALLNFSCGTQSTTSTSGPGGPNFSSTTTMNFTTTTYNPPSTAQPSTTTVIIDTTTVYTTTQTTIAPTTTLIPPTQTTVTTISPTTSTVYIQSTTLPPTSTSTIMTTTSFFTTTSTMAIVTTTSTILATTTTVFVPTSTTTILPTTVTTRTSTTRTTTITTLTTITTRTTTTVFVPTTTTTNLCMDNVLYNDAFSGQYWVVENGNDIQQFNWAAYSGGFGLQVQVGDWAADGNDYAAVGYYFNASQTCVDMSTYGSISFYAAFNAGTNGAWDIALAQDAGTISNYITLNPQPDGTWREYNTNLGLFTGVTKSCIRGMVFRGHTNDNWGQVTVDLITLKCPAGPITTQTTNTLPTTTTNASSNTLRALATAKGLYFGAAVAATPLNNEAQYQDVLKQEFNMVVAENVMKWDSIHPAVNTYNYTQADQLMNFAVANNMAARGHVFVWHSQLPGWVTSSGYTKAQAQTMMQSHINNVFGHFTTNYPGRIKAWDVVNEAVADGGGYRTGSWWYTTWGNNIDFIKDAFQYADAYRDANDPSVELYYNDYNIEYSSAKSDTAYSMIQSLLSQGVPIDGVGFQMHISNTFPSLAQIETQFDRFISLGVDIQITELDIKFQHTPNATELIQQAARYRSILEMCLERPQCTAFLIWGFTDKYTWIAQPDAPLIFDTLYNPKPAYYELQAELLE